MKFIAPNIGATKCAMEKEFDFAVECAAEARHFEMVQYLCENGALCDEDNFNGAVKGNDMEICKYVYSKCVEAGNTMFDRWEMYRASDNNNLEMVKYLWEVAKAPCDFATLDHAAMHGNMEMVRYLVETCKCGYDSCQIISSAAEHGHLDIIKYLVASCPGITCVCAINKAARNGHLDAVKYLFETLKDTCTAEAMDDAACYGHLEVVIYLHRVVKAKHTRNAMLRAALYNHLEVVKYLYTFVKFTPKLITEVIAKSKKRKHFEIAAFLEFATNKHKI